MKIYIGHSTSFDFQNELYKIIRESDISQQHEIIFPHEKSDEQFSSKTLFQSGCDLMIAEVSWPSTGLGIELGWADTHHVPVVCIYRKGSKVSGALKVVSQNFFEYENPSDILRVISKYLTERTIARQKPRVR
ncbi:MAG: hypothetical protein A2233_00460 [Candidatus Kerfeldbacteria bacterium RIFOXYA2_FULL_38_24]|nr:MAG: hypothetical protein A2233_00460 [Candidatus Kerfeldbacteria bacterium RIFOXYA2_FULL_38_24]